MSEINLSTAAATRVKQRDTAIDMLKCIGIFLIIWSHLDAVLPSPSMAVGGALGNALFFFCSGFTLLNNINGGG